MSHLFDVQEHFAQSACYRWNSFCNVYLLYFSFCKSDCQLPEADETPRHTHCISIQNGAARILEWSRRRRASIRFRKGASYLSRSLPFFIWSVLLCNDRMQQWKIHREKQSTCAFSAMRMSVWTAIFNRLFSHSYTTTSCRRVPSWILPLCRDGDTVSHRLSESLFQGGFAFWGFFANRTIFSQCVIESPDSEEVLSTNITLYIDLHTVIDDFVSIYCRWMFRTRGCLRNVLYVCITAEVGQHRRRCVPVFRNLSCQLCLISFTGPKKCKILVCFLLLVLWDTLEVV